MTKIKGGPLQEISMESHVPFMEMCDLIITLSFNAFDFPSGKLTNCYRLEAKYLCFCVWELKFL
jgi:hypothetical protein